MTIVTAVGYVSFSFDAETSLSRIYLEDPKFDFLKGHLEQMTSADLAAVGLAIICES